MQPEGCGEPTATVPLLANHRAQAVPRHARISAGVLAHVAARALRSVGGGRGVIIYKIYKTLLYSASPVRFSDVDRSVFQSIARCYRARRSPPNLPTSQPPPPLPGHGSEWSSTHHALVPNLEQLWLTAEACATSDALGGCAPATLGWCYHNLAREMQRQQRQVRHFS